MKVYVITAGGLSYVCANLKAAKRVFNNICAEWAVTCELTRKIEANEDAKCYVYTHKTGGNRIISYRPCPLIEA